MTSPLLRQDGISLLVVLVMLAILGLSLGLAGSTWKTVVQRSKEAELLFRGDQYRKAIESYASVKHGGASGMLPAKLEDLLRDPRFPGVVRHIRKLYKDPMTGGDFELIKDPRYGNRIKGVYSSSDEAPFKAGGFPQEYATFANAESYQDWKFIYEPKQPQQRRPAGSGQQPPASGHPVFQGGQAN
ncbi:type II secretion system protein [Geothermobacter ehrlichii]|nr:type II secretion system protein [Geothermobacter ehrlichii]